jgi:phosphatidylethanolamine N-methyltransferase
MLALLLVYVVLGSSLPVLSYHATLALHFAHACAWCMFHSFGLGLLLRAQSKSKYLVRHFLKHYHYPSRDHGDGAVQEAFTNWKALYNISLCMTYSVYLRFLHDKPLIRKLCGSFTDEFGVEIIHSARCLV